MIVKKHRTKIIWSLNSKDLTEGLAKELAEMKDISALRINYDPENVDKIHSFIPKLYEFRDPRSEKIPVMIDVGSTPRGVVRGAHGTELRYGDEITLSLPGEGGHIEIESKDWDNLFAVDQKVFLGLGSVLLRTLKVDKKQ